MPSVTASHLSQIEAYARERTSGHDPAHDDAHVARVVHTARAIAAGEPAADAFIVEAAAWLHDIVQLPKGSGPPGEAARRSADEAATFLSTLSIEPHVIAAICSAIRTHSFSGGLQPESIEAAIVQDADRIDALGAIGLARLWVTAAVLDSDLYAVEDPAAESRPLNDRAYGLDHIEAKLLKLPDTMNTATGREIARRRAEFVRAYRTQFLAELSGTL